MRAVNWLAAGTLLLLAAARAEFLPGAADPNFRPVLAEHEKLKDLTLAPDGSVYVLLDERDSFGHQVPLIVRFLPDGTRDTRFAAPPAANPRVTRYTYRSITAGPDGRVYVEGVRTTQNDPRGGSRTNSERRGPLSLLRADGTFDVAYGRADVWDRALHSYHPTAEGRVWTVGCLADHAGQSLVCLGPDGGILAEAGGLHAPQGAWFNLNSVLERTGDRLLLAGQLYWQDLSPTVGFAQIGPDGKVDPEFKPPPEGFNGGQLPNVWQAAIDHEDRILVAGLFQLIGRHATTNAARLQRNGQVDTGFRVGPMDGEVNRIWGDPVGRVFVVGRFSRIQMVPRPGLARLQEDGSLDQTYAPELPPGATTAAVVKGGDGHVLVGGSSLEAGKLVSFVTRLLAGDAKRVPPAVLLEPEGIRARVGAEHTLSPLVRASADARLQWYRNGEPVAGATNACLLLPRLRMEHNGSYRLVVESPVGSASTRPVLIVVQPARATAGSPDTATDFQGGPNDRVFALRFLRDGKLLVGGAFEKFGEIPTGALGVLNEDGQLNLELTRRYSVRGQIHQLIPDGEGILVAGAFSQIGGHNTRGLARLNADGSVDTQMRSQLSPLSRVDSVARLGDGGFLLTGELATGPNRRVDWMSLVKLLPDGSLDTAFGQRLDLPGSRYHAARMADGRIFLLGWDDGREHRGFIQTLLADGNPAPDQPRLELEELRMASGTWVLPVGPSGVLMGGRFRLRGPPKEYSYGVAEFHHGALVHQLMPERGSRRFEDTRCGIIDREGRLVIAGSYLTRHSGGNQDDTFQATFDHPVYCLAEDAYDHYYAGGEFQKVCDVVRPHLVRLYGSDRTEPYLVGPFRSEQGLVLQVETNEGWNYEVESCTDLQGGPWEVATRFQGDGKLATLGSDTTNAAQRYFRVRVRP